MSALRQCACGRETFELVECAVCQQERVIRAAPEMLAALQAVVLSDDTSCGFSKACRQARAAVNAALGPNQEVQP